MIVQGFPHRSDTDVLMRTVVAYLSPVYDDHLRRLVEDAQLFFHEIGYGPVRQQIEVIQLDCMRRLAPVALQLPFRHQADAAAGTVLEDGHRPVEGPVDDLVELLRGMKSLPILWQLLSLLAEKAVEKTHVVFRLILLRIEGYTIEVAGWFIG